MDHFVDIGVGGNLDTPLGAAVVLQVPCSLMYLTPEAAVDLAARLSHWAESMKLARHEIMTGGARAQFLLTPHAGGRQ